MQLNIPSNSDNNKLVKNSQPGLQPCQNNREFVGNKGHFHQFHPKHKWFNGQAQSFRGRGHYGGSRGGQRGSRGDHRGSRGHYEGSRGRGRGRGTHHGRIWQHDDGDLPKQLMFQGKTKTNDDRGPLNFYCCSCDRGFKNEEQLGEHKSEHIICGLDGCQFEAHALVVTKHVKMQHSGTLYERMKNLNSPEAINAWREERKKNFPSAKNIQLKKEKLQEMVDRREIYGLKGVQNNFNGTAPFRYKIKPTDEHWPSLHYRMRRIEYEQSERCKFSTVPSGHSNTRVPLHTLNKSEVVTMESFYLNVGIDINGKLQKQKKVRWKGFKARQLDSLPDSDSEDDGASIPISDEEDNHGFQSTMSGNAETGTDEAVSKSKLPNQTQITGLMLVDYSSASDSESELVTDPSNGDNTVQSKEMNIHSVGKLSSRSNQTHVTSGTDESFESSDSDSSSETQSEDNDDIDDFVIEEFENKSQFRYIPVATSRFSSRGRRYRKPRLIQRLLENPIRKERNIILQACRYLCENDFFMEQKKPKLLENTSESNSVLEIGTSENVIVASTVNQDASTAP